jgi:hypothetical protein
MACRPAQATTQPRPQPNPSPTTTRTPPIITLLGPNPQPLPPPPSATPWHRAPPPATINHRPAVRPHMPPTTRLLPCPSTPRNQNRALMDAINGWLLPSSHHPSSAPLLAPIKGNLDPSSHLTSSHSKLPSTPLAPPRWARVAATLVCHHTASSPQLVPHRAPQQQHRLDLYLPGPLRQLSTSWNTLAMHHWPPPHYSIASPICSPRHQTSPPVSTLELPSPFLDWHGRALLRGATESHAPMKLCDAHDAGPWWAALSLVHRSVDSVHKISY